MGTASVTLALMASAPCSVSVVAAMPFMAGVVSVRGASMRV
jgi:hypothetical protein